MGKTSAKKAKLPKEPFELLHFSMARVHDTFKYGYDRITANLENPPTDDLRNFLGYCGVWAEAISGHHQAEESLIFPVLNEKMDFSGELSAHQIIHDKLEALIEAINSAKADHSKFQPAEMLELMVKLREPLFQHLDEEVEHLHPDNMRNAGMDPKDIASVMKSIDKHAKKIADPWKMVPYITSHTAAEYKAIFPPIPWLFRKVVIPYVFAKRYSGYWKYAPFPVS